MQDRYLRKLNIELVDGEYRSPTRGQIRDPQAVYETFKAIKDQNQETLLGLFLDNELQVRAYDVLSLGSDDQTLFVPEQVFEHAIITKSKSFILIHNHPKGDPRPSPADEAVMATLQKQSPIMNRDFMDFIIVGEDSYWSMFEENDGGEYSLGAL